VNLGAPRGYSPGMRPIALWRHEARRAGWTALLGPPAVLGLAVVGGVLQEGAGGGEGEVARTLQAALEMLLPLTAGIGAASLIGHDPVAELAASCRTRYPVTLLRRLVLSLGWVAALAVLMSAVLAATGWWDRMPGARPVVSGQLTWLSPTLLLVALGFLTGVVVRNPGAAAGVVAVVWLTEQALTPQLQSHVAGRLLYLFATTRGARAEDWLANRLVLLAAAAVLLAAAWLLLARSEPVVRGEGS
jgi:hypothetical protein